MRDSRREKLEGDKESMGRQERERDDGNDRRAGRREVAAEKMEIEEGIGGEIG